MEETARPAGIRPYPIKLQRPQDPPALLQLRKGLPEAASVVWDWQGVGAREQERANRRKARLQGTLQGLIGAGLGLLVFFFWSRTLAYVVWGIAGLTFTTALLSPDLLEKERTSHLPPIKL